MKSTTALTHSLTHSRVYLFVCGGREKRKKERAREKIDSQLYSWRQNRTFAHTNEFPTFYPHSHILSTKFPTFLGQLSTFFRHFSTCFPHFLASFPHFSGVSHILPTFTYVHIFIKSQTFVYTNEYFHIVNLCIYKYMLVYSLKVPFFTKIASEKSPKMPLFSRIAIFWNFPEKGRFYFFAF